MVTGEQLFQGLDLFVLGSASHRGGVKVDRGVGEHLWIRFARHGQQNHIWVRKASDGECECDELEPY